MIKILYYVGLVLVISGAALFITLMLGVASTVIKDAMEYWKK